jgi:hypothetical protein
MVDSIDDSTPACGFIRKSRSNCVNSGSALKTHRIFDFQMLFHPKRANKNISDIFNPFLDLLFD